jgi:hypothetical protein
LCKKGEEITPFDGISVTEFDFVCENGLEKKTTVECLKEQNFEKLPVPSSPVISSPFLTTTIFFSTFL